MIARLAVICCLALAGCSSDQADPSSRADADGLDVLQIIDVASGDTPLPDALTQDSAPAAPIWRPDGPVTLGEAAPVRTPYFVEVTDAALPAFEGSHERAAVVDLDGDGLDDLVTWPVDAAGAMFPRALRNTGAGTFEDITEAIGFGAIQAATMVFADVDNDGDADLFTGISFRAAEGQPSVWLNELDTTGQFTSNGGAGIATARLGLGSGGAFVYKEQAAAGFADFDGDGALDLYIGHWHSGSTEGTFLPAADELYRGNGSGSFQAVALPDQHNPLTSEADPALAGANRNAYGLAIGDYDGDGDPDIFVNNYGAGRPGLDSAPSYWDHNFLWRNDSAPGSFAFVDVAADVGVAATTRGIGGIEQETPVVLGGKTYPGPIGGNGFGCQWGDIDNDGDLDLIIATIAHPDYPQSDRTMLHVNGGPGAMSVFSEESAARGLEYAEDELHPALVDIDGDGRLDLAMSRLRGGTKLEVYLQSRADGSFDRQADYAVSGIDVERPGSTLWLDYDGDGDLDAFMAKGSGRLYENRAGDGNRNIKVRLVGKGPRDATGARVQVTTLAGLQTREVTSGNGHYNTQLSHELVFGLGGDSGARDVTIRWPDGEVQVLGDVRAGVALTVEQGGEIEATLLPITRGR